MVMLGDFQKKGGKKSGHAEHVKTEVWRHQESEVMRNQRDNKYLQNTAATSSQHWNKADVHKLGK